MNKSKFSNFSKAALEAGFGNLLEYMGYEIEYFQEEAELAESKNEAALNKQTAKVLEAIYDELEIFQKSL